MGETPWISAADQLPEDGQEVLVWHGGYICNEVYVARVKSWKSVDHNEPHCDISDDDYWMPLPPPPHKGE